MVSLIPTSMITVAIIKTLLLLTIIMDGVFPANEVEKCTKYIKQLYIVKEPLDMFVNGFLLFNKREINKINERLAPITEPEVSPEIIVLKMNKYTYGYFKDMLSNVLIEGKDTLLTPFQFCQENFNRNIFSCTRIIHKYLYLKRNESGSRIFDILYKKWSKQDIESITSTEEDEVDARRLLFEDGPPEDIEKLLPRVGQYFTLVTACIGKYYQQFEDIIYNANAEGIPTPEEYCQKTVNATYILVED